MSDFMDAAWPFLLIVWCVGVVVVARVISWWGSRKLAAALRGAAGED